MVVPQMVVVTSARLLGFQLVGPNMIWLHSKWYCLKCYCARLSTGNLICGCTPNEGSYQCGAPSLLVAPSLIVAVLQMVVVYSAIGLGSLLVATSVMLLVC